MAAIAKREVGVPRTGAEELILTVRRVSQPSVRDVLLVGLTFSSGAVDAITFLALGKGFTAFMTGNLVFFGLGLAGAEVAGAFEAVAASGALLFLHARSSAPILPLVAAGLVIATASVALRPPSRTSPQKENDLND